MDFAGPTQGSVQIDIKGVSFKILNTTLNYNLTSMQEEWAYEETVSFNPVIKKGTDENLQLAHPNRTLWDFRNEGSQ